MIKIGETLFLDIRKAGQEPQKFQCKVEDIREDHLLVTYPSNLRTNKSEFFMVGTKFYAHFTTKDKITYKFHTEMTDRKKEHIPLLILSFPGENNLEKIQRREFVRVDTAIDIAIHPADYQFQPFAAITSDVSAGGCAIILPEQHRLKEGMEVNCWMVLPLKDQHRYVKQKAKVIRIIKGENGKRDKAPLQFMKITERDKQHMLRFCFEEQLMLKKRGLL
ncbi:flagellar brake protein [Bacillus sp. Marseille-Q3570]|uniref:flagellar brake protein n=1 Tax=Bacillus sp. Marseille-Q3570 TaxID=2963522 RepID=UPI0021B7FE86|nr:PilZ domain-containing protein [Bacillus sp. Marseille-Q3570]